MELVLSLVENGYTLLSYRKGVGLPYSSPGIHPVEWNLPEALEDIVVEFQRLALVEAVNASRAAKTGRVA